MFADSCRPSPQPQIHRPTTMLLFRSRCRTRTPAGPRWRCACFGIPRLTDGINIVHQYSFGVRKFRFRREECSNLAYFRQGASRQDSISFAISQVYLRIAYTRRLLFRNIPFQRPEMAARKVKVSKCLAVRKSMGFAAVH